MPSMGFYAAVGGLGGLGKGIVEQAMQAREDALREQQEAREDAIRAEDMDFDREMLSRREGYQTAAWERQRAAGLADEQRGLDRQRARTGRIANVYESIFGTESGGNFDAANDEGYMGRGQFGQDRLDDWSRANGTPRITTAEFRANPDLQRDIEQWHFADVNGFIDKNGLAEYEGQTIGGVPITRSGLIAMAHLGGSEGMKRFLESGGRYNPADSNGTKLSDYARTHGGLSTEMDPAIWDVIADSETPADVRDDLRRAAGLDQGGAGAGPASYSNVIWHDNGDGTQTRVGVNSRTGKYEPIPGPDGQPVTEPTGSGTEAATEASAQLRFRLQREFADEYPEAEMLDAVEEEVLRLMDEEGMAEAEALRAAQGAMIYESPDGQLARRGTEAAEGGSFTGEFRYGQPQPQGTPQMPGEPTTTGVSAGDALTQARDAISRGADRNAVIARLRELGIDPRGI